jgi:DNA-binding beta-propeller fold protein YncE
MPLTGRLMAGGTRLINACGMEDQVLEINTPMHRIVRRFSVAEDAEGAVDTVPVKPASEFMEGRVLEPTCSPTAAEPSPKGDRIWIACNRNSSVVEMDARRWLMVSRLETGHGPYAMAVTPDAKQLIVVLRQGAGVQFFDTNKNTPRDRVPTSADAPQSIAISPDGRYAFVSCAGTAQGDGALDVFDTTTHKRVASLALNGKPGVVAFWKTEP